MQVELLTIEESFHISELGVVIIPDFSVPEGWKNRSESVVVIQPNGKQLESLARFNCWHFNIPDPKVSIDKRWRVVVYFPDLTKEDLQIGCRIMVSTEIANALLPKDIGPEDRND